VPDRAGSGQYRRQIILGAHRAAALAPDTGDPAMLRPQPERDGPDCWAMPDDLIAAFIAYVLPLLPEGPIWECASFVSDRYPQDETPPRDFLTVGPPARGVIAATNPPFNALNEFLARGDALLDARAIEGFVLLLRHDHLTAAERVGVLNRATFELHCNWRPTWIAGTEDNSPRHSFCWVGWLPDQPRLAPRYLDLEGLVRAGPC
jgi:hypothetical protein